MCYVILDSYLYATQQVLSLFKYVSHYIHANEKANSYTNHVYINNQRVNLKPRDALLALQCNPVDGMPVLHF